ncbi:MAG: hypothetical protein HN341_11680 [Verrucomicrobia bacterium]|nr:hypothetical protein [Verrucomicrobiota bacterium]
MEKHSFAVDKVLFPRSVILRACHASLGSCPIELESGDDGYWQVSLQLTGEELEGEEELEGRFRSSLINEAFRDSLMEHAQNTKELIVAKALYGVGEEDIELDPPSRDSVGMLMDLDAELDDYKADPLGIAIPWEEKYGQVDTKNGSRRDKEEQSSTEGPAS